MLKGKKSKKIVRKNKPEIKYEAGIIEETPVTQNDNNKLEVKIINKSIHELPKYATEGSSGMDLRANINKNKRHELKPLERMIVPTGIYIELPQGYEAQIRPRSGLAAKHGITVLNSPGTIDYDYKGEIKVILVNLSNETIFITNGERIAQMVFTPVSKATLVETDELTKTERGEGGFGHTGKN